MYSSKRRKLNDAKSEETGAPDEPPAAGRPLNSSLFSQLAIFIKGRPPSKASVVSFDSKRAHPVALVAAGLDESFGGSASVSLVPSQRRSLGQLLESLSRVQLPSEMDPIINEIKSIGFEALAKLKSSRFVFWMRDEGINQLRLRAAARLASQGLLDIRHFLSGSHHILGEHFVEDLRACARQDGDLFSFLMFSILRTIDDVAPAQKDSVRELEDLISKLCNKDFRTEDDAFSYCAVLHAIEELKPLESAENALIQFLIAFLRTPDSLVEAQAQLDILERLGISPSADPLLERVCTEWVRIASARAIINEMFERVRSGDIDWICGIPLLLLIRQEREASEIPRLLDAMMELSLTAPLNEHMLKVTLLCAGIVLPKTQQLRAANALVTYAEWLQKVLSSEKAATAAVIISAMTQIISRQPAETVQLNSALLAKFHKSKPESNEYIQIAKRVAPGSANRSDQLESPEELVSSSIKQFSNTGKIPSKLKLVKNMQRAHFRDRIVPLLLEPSLDDTRVRFVETCATEGILTAAQFDKFRRECDSMKIPQKEEAPIIQNAKVRPSIQNVVVSPAKQNRSSRLTQSKSIAEIKACLSALMLPATQTMSALSAAINIIASSLQGGSADNAPVDQAQEVADCIFNFLLQNETSPSSSAGLDVSLGEQIQQQPAAAASVSSQPSSALSSSSKGTKSLRSFRLSIRLFRLFIDGIRPHQKLCDRLISRLNTFVGSGEFLCASRLQLFTLASIFVGLTAVKVKEDPPVEITNWAESLILSLPIQTVESLRNTTEFLLLLLRVLETGFDTLFVLSVGAQVPNTTKPKSNNYCDTIGLLPESVPQLLSVVFERLTHEFKIGTTAIANDENILRPGFKELEGAFESAFFHAVTTRASAISLSSLLAFSTKLPSKAHGCEFLKSQLSRRYRPATADRRALGDFLTALADCCLKQGSTSTYYHTLIECIIESLQEQVPQSAGDDGVTGIWALNWLELTLNRNANDENIQRASMNIVEALPPKFLFLSLGEALPSQASLLQVAEFAQRVFLPGKARLNAFEILPAEFWFSGLSRLLSNALLYPPQTVKLVRHHVRAFLQSPNVISLSMVLNWRKIEQRDFFFQKRSNHQPEINDIQQQQVSRIFDFARSIHDSARSVLTSVNLSSELELVFSAINISSDNSSTGALFLAHCLTAAISNPVPWVVSYHSSKIAANHTNILRLDQSKSDAATLVSSIRIKISELCSSCVQEIRKSSDNQNLHIFLCALVDCLVAASSKEHGALYAPSGGANSSGITSLQKTIWSIVLMYPDALAIFNGVSSVPDPIARHRATCIAGAYDHLKAASCLVKILCAPDALYVPQLLYKMKRVGKASQTTLISSLVLTWLTVKSSELVDAFVELLKSIRSEGLLAALPTETQTRWKSEDVDTYKKVFVI